MSFLNPHKNNMIIRIIGKLFMSKHHIVFSYGDDEHMPVLLSFSHNLKPQNVVICDSSLVYRGPVYSILKKTTTLFDKEITLLLTFSYFNNKENFMRGFAYIHDEEYPISTCYTYSSLQIGQYAYDNITVIRMDSDIFM